MFLFRTIYILTSKYLLSFVLTISIGLALLPVCDLGPVAHAGKLIEPESGGAGVLLGDTIDTGVEDVAHGGVGVGVETVQPRAKVAGALGGL